MNETDNVCYEQQCKHKYYHSEENEQLIMIIFELGEDNLP
jgi:hypothetical protein